MEFAIDFGNTAKPLFAAVPGQIVSLGNGEVAYQSVAQGSTHVMTAEVGRALNLCGAFRRIDDHVDLIVRRLPALADKRDAVRGVLENLAKLGLMQSDRELVARLARAGSSAAPAAFGSIFIRACDRPEQLGALLRTLADYHRQFPVPRRYVVLDDSRDSEAMRRNRALLDEFRREAPAAQVQHFDASRWAALVERLAQAVPQAAGAVRFALARSDADGPRRGPGKGFNLATLLGAGTRYVMLDEDFLFQFRADPDARNGYALQRQFGFPVWLMDDQAAALGRGIPYEADPFEWHLARCGHTLGALLARDGESSLPADGITGHALGSLPLEPETRIVASDNGHRGSSRHHGSLFLFRLEGQARDYLRRDAETFERNLAAPALWHGPARAEFVEGINVTPFMLDGSRLLPPTVPTATGEDALFGAFTRYLYPESLLLQSNLTIAHVQEESRSRRETLTRPFTPAMRDLLGEIAQGAHTLVKTADPVGRMGLLSGLVRDLGEAPPQRAIEVLAGFIAQQRSQHVKVLQDTLAAAGDAPSWWNAVLRDATLATGRTLTTWTTPRLDEWPDTLDERASAAHLAAELGRYGDLLQHWPALWQHAAAEGERLLRE